MKKVYLHYKNNINSMLYTLYLLLIPFIIYGFYKNGYLLYSMNAISLISLFKPLLFLFISFIMGIIFTKLNKEKMWHFTFYSNILIGVVIPYNINIFIYILFLLIVNLFNLFKRCNIIGLFMSFVFIYSLFKKNIFLTFLDNGFNYNFGDLLLGRGIGGIANTFFIMNLISLFVLSFKIEYKKIVAFGSIGLYYLLIFIYFIFDRSNISNFIINNQVIFPLIFVSSLSIYSPYTKGGMILYAIILGIFSFLFTIFNASIFIYGIIFLGSFFYKIFDKFFCKD